MRRVTLDLPDELADAIDECARGLGIDSDQYAVAVLARHIVSCQLISSSVESTQSETKHATQTQAD
jgi:hypothetical protein